MQPRSADARQFGKAVKELRLKESNESAALGGRLRTGYFICGTSRTGAAKSYSRGNAGIGFSFGREDV